MKEIKMQKWIILFLILLIFSGCKTNPNETIFKHNAAVTGKVYFEEGAPDTLQAKVEIQNQDYGIVIDETFTDESGGYQFSQLSAAEYLLTFSAENYQELQLVDITLEDEVTTLVDSVLLKLIQPIEFREIVVDGSIDENWQPVYQNLNNSNWSAMNDFQNLYLARDDENLYLALEATRETQNSLNLYLDIDYDASSVTGTNDFSTINSEIASGNLVKNVTCPSSFGADIGFCLFGDNSTEFKNLNDPEYDYETYLQMGNGVIEMSIPFANLYENGNFPENGKIAIVALIGGGDANTMSNDTIPQQNVHFGEEGYREFNSVFSRQY